MNENPQKRKLSAILSADVQGYSRLMGDDEALTVDTITRYRKCFYDCTEKHGGRVINAPGDAVLAEFPSVVDAVRCSVAIQDRLAEANAELPDHRRMVFRIGVNIGDVIHKGNDIYGDGVNIAARVENLADGGGICITRQVYDQVKNRLPNLAFSDMGKHPVKNIDEPVHIYRIVMTSDGTGPVDSLQQTDATAETVNNQTVAIAVMPFDNFSGDREHDYFTIGFVEDLITDLSHFSSLHVISSFTTQKMVETSKDVLSVADELGIDYLLRGNLRRLGGQVRISTQLLVASGGRVLWAERYDAPINTLFDIQDDIVSRVVNAISTQIDKVLLAAARRKPMTSMAAYDFWLRGMARLRQGTPETDREARKMFGQALVVDPHYSRAYAGLSLSHFNDWSCQLWEKWEITERKAFDYAMRAFELDESDHVVQMILGRILLFRRQFDLASQHLDNALMLNANDADNLVQIAACMAFLGDAERGEQLFLKSLKLNPYRESWYYAYGAWPYMILRRYDNFLETALKGPLTDVWIDQPAYIAVAYAYKGEHDQAARYLDLFKKAFAEEILKSENPSPEEIISWMHKANPLKRESDFTHIIDGLTLAGLDVRKDVPREKLSATAPPQALMPTNEFKKANGLWRMTFDSMSVQLQEVKGFLDLAVLLARPGVEAHCSQLMGSPVRIDDREQVIDDKARQEYETRIRDLQEAIAEAETMNDLVRYESLEKELDQLTDHLSKALGLGGKTRIVSTGVDRARSAVTWRIRSAIKKIKTVHPSLGNHLALSVRTGTFCCYTPEKEHIWHL